MIAESLVTQQQISSAPPTSVLTPELATPPIIKTEHASVLLGKEVALRDLTLSMSPGIIFGLIGPSGSGKTTTIRLLTGLYKPTEGQALVMGEAPFEFQTKTRERIGYMPQQFVLYRRLSVWENINFVASLYGMPLLRRRNRLRQLLEFVELDEHRSKLGNQLSGGMQRRLALA